jgi:hypothetical protein
MTIVSLSDFDCLLHRERAKDRILDRRIEHQIVRTAIASRQAKQSQHRNGSNWHCEQVTHLLGSRR